MATWRPRIRTNTAPRNTNRSIDSVPRLWSSSSYNGSTDQYIAGIARRSDGPTGPCLSAIAPPFIWTGVPLPDGDSRLRRMKRSNTRPASTPALSPCACTRDAVMRAAASSVAIPLQVGSSSASCTRWSISGWESSRSSSLRRSGAVIPKVPAHSRQACAETGKLC